MFRRGPPMRRMMRPRPVMTGLVVGATAGAVSRRTGGKSSSSSSSGQTTEVHHYHSNPPPPQGQPAGAQPYYYYEHPPQNPPQQPYYQYPPPPQGQPQPMTPEQHQQYQLQQQQFYQQQQQQQQKQQPPPQATATVVTVNVQKDQPEKTTVSSASTAATGESKPSMAEPGVEYITDIRMAESKDFSELILEVKCPGVTKFKGIKKQVKVKAYFGDKSFDVKIEYKSKTYGLELNGKQLYKPIVSKKCEYKIETDQVKITLRKVKAETWRSDGGRGALKLLASDA